MNMFQFLATSLLKRPIFLQTTATVPDVITVVGDYATGNRKMTSGWNMLGGSPSVPSSARNWGKRL